MILTLEQWEGILTAVNQDEGSILKAIKEKLNEKYGDTCQEREFDANHLFDVSLTINNIQYNVKFPLLHIVAINGHLEIIKHLIEKGANVDKKTNNRLTPLCLAVLTGHKDVVTAPLEKGANIDEKKEKLNEKYGDTCQEREFDANHLFDVSLTINNIQYNVKFPLLHIVAINGHLEIIKHLIEKGANVDKKTNNRLTPLCLAVLTGHKDVVTAPLEKGANIDEKEADKWTPLHFAAINGHLEIVKHLIEKGANVDRKAINGFTPLHLATRYGHKEVITTLLGKGANVNEKTADGWTPLCLAALTGHKDVVTTLLEKRANPLIRNKDGETPRNLANDENIIQLLKDAETKQIISKASRVENWRASFRAWWFFHYFHPGPQSKIPIFTFPAPASSNAACGFPALRFPSRFLPKFITYCTGCAFGS